MHQGTGRQRVAYISGINIASAPPHSPQKYLNIFEYLGSGDINAIGSFGNERLTLSTQSIEGDIISGTFIRYTYIDPNSPWWDSQERKILVDEEGKPIPQVRYGIGPNTKPIYFSFDINRHILLVDLHNISINQMVRALGSIFSSDNFKSVFGEINSTIIPSSDAIEKVLSLRTIKRIKMSLTIPNADVASLSEEEIYARMNGMNAGKIEHEYVCQTDKSLEPDDELKLILNVASRNGYVSSSGRNERDKKESRSTKAYPKRERETYPASVNRFDAIKSIAKALFRLF